VAEGTCWEAYNAYLMEREVCDNCVVNITTAPVSIFPGETFQCNASNDGKCDNTPCYNWQVIGDSGGSIDDAGLYTAGNSTGTDTIIVIDNCNGGISDQSTVDIVPIGDKGITLDRENGTIYIIDILTEIASGPFLQGSYSSLWDIVTTADANTAIVSAFLDKKVVFLDITNINLPQVSAEVDFSNIPTSTDPFYPEDLALTPDEKYILVTDGGECSYDIAHGVASISVQTQTFVQYLTLSSPKKGQSISIDKYNNVYVGDYCENKLYMISIDSVNGTLTDTGIEISLPITPFNSYISPEGDKLIVIGTYGVVIFEINGPGSITQKQFIPDLDGDTVADRLQSSSYSADGTKIYFGDRSASPDRIIVMNIEQDDSLSFSETIDILTDHKRGFYGVDVMQIEPKGEKLYMGNMSSGGGTGAVTTNEVMILDLSDKTLSTVALGIDSHPAGIAFKGVGDGQGSTTTTVTSSTTTTVDGITTTTAESDTTTSVDGSITTTSVTCDLDSCCTKKIYGEHSEETELLRYIRDAVLSQSPEGQEIIRMYYQWSPAIVKAMEADDEFKEEVKEMIDGVLELIGGE